MSSSAKKENEFVNPAFLCSLLGEESERLKLVLSNAAVEFSRTIQLQFTAEGIRCETTDTSQAMAMNLILKKCMFRKWQLAKPLRIGLDVVTLRKSFSNYKRGNLITLAISADKSLMRLRFEDKETDDIKDLVMNTLTIEGESIVVPEMLDEVDTTVQIFAESSDIYRFINNNNGSGNDVHVMANRKRFHLSIEGEGSSRATSVFHARTKKAPHRTVDITCPRNLRAVGKFSYVFLKRVFENGVKMSNLACISVMTGRPIRVCFLINKNTTGDEEEDEENGGSTSSSSKKKKTKSKLVRLGDEESEAGEEEAVASGMKHEGKKLGAVTYYIAPHAPEEGEEDHAEYLDADSCSSTEEESEQIQEGSDSDAEEPKKKEPAAKTRKRRVNEEDDDDSDGGNTAPEPPKKKTKKQTTEKPREDSSDEGEERRKKAKGKGKKHPAESFGGDDDDD